MKKQGCPACGDKNVYVGLVQVECATPGCRNFSQRQAAAVWGMSYLDPQFRAWTMPRS